MLCTIRHVFLRTNRICSNIVPRFVLKVDCIRDILNMNLSVQEFDYESKISDRCGRAQSWYPGRLLSEDSPHRAGALRPVRGQPADGAAGAFSPGDGTPDRPEAGQRIAHPRTEGRFLSSQAFDRRGYHLHQRLYLPQHPARNRGRLFGKQQRPASVCHTESVCKRAQDPHDPARHGASGRYSG